MSQEERTLSIPRLPILGIDSLASAPAIDVHCILDRRAALFTTSGRAAILHALRAFEVKEGDQVLVPSYHCPTMIAPVVRIGARPVFYPIDSNGDPDLDFARSAMSNGAKAILVVHYFGLPRPMREMRKLCDERGVRLIEDCAHTFFGPRDGDLVGTLGDVAIASLPKFFPVIEGGLLIGPPEILANVRLTPPPFVNSVRGVLDVVELGARHGRFGALNLPATGVIKLKEFVRRSAAIRIEIAEEPSASADQVSWLDDSRCAFRASKPTRWLTERTGRERLARHRRRNYALLSKLLAASSGARPLRPTLPDGVVPYVFPLEVDEPDRAYRAIRRQGVPVFRWDQLWPGVPANSSDVGLQWSRSVFQIGCHQDITESDVSLIANLVLRAVEN
jgi:perosamine synthetase